MDAVIATGVLISIMLMAILATLFDRLSRRVDEIDQKITQVESRLRERSDVVDANVGSAQLEMRTRLDAMNSRLDAVVAECATTTGRVLRLEQRA